MNWHSCQKDTFTWQNLPHHVFISMLLVVISTKYCSYSANLLCGQKYDNWGKTCFCQVNTDKSWFEYFLCHNGQMKHMPYNWHVDCISQNMMFVPHIYVVQIRTDMNRLHAAFCFFTLGHWNQTGTFSDAAWMHSWWYKIKIYVVLSFNIQLSLASHSFSKSSERKNIPVVSPVTLMLCLWAASMTAGTRSSVGSPWSSATPGGYQDNTSTPITPQHGEEVWSEYSQAWSLNVMKNVGG